MGAMCCDGGKVAGGDGVIQVCSRGAGIIRVRGCVEMGAHHLGSLGEPSPAAAASPGSAPDVVSLSAISASAPPARHAFLRSFPGLLIEFAHLRLDRAGGEWGAACRREEGRLGMVAR